MKKDSCALLGAFAVCISWIALVTGQQLICENRNPEGYTVSKTAGDGGFKIITVGPAAAKNQYVPNEVYTVKIQGVKTRYSTQKFTEFLLVAESEKQAMMGQSGLVTTGIFHIIDDSQSRFSDFCPDGVTSLNLSPKSEISVLWTAPSVLVASCITFKVTLVERPHIWYMDDLNLTKTLCPEMPAPPKSQQMTLDKDASFSSGFEEHVGRGSLSSQPPTLAAPSGTASPETVQDKCCACDDAKYEVIFEGIWSKETHPRDFPENEWLLHFSDIIGASHSRDYYFFEVGKEASEGIRQVAEWGATRHLENELKANSRYINTIIKARGLWHPNEKGKTSAAFRVDKSHHLMSLVSMIGPSPDWIVGISGFELCLKNCTWLDEASFDLYPYDAGTDSGITYMSPNSPQEPRGKIRAITTTDPDDPRSPFHDPAGSQMSPFARAHIRRQKIYPKTCNDSRQTLDSSHEVVIAENTEEANRPECAVTDWTAWSDCSVACGKGLRMRKRSYVTPAKATMNDCDRQLVEKEMCLGQVPICDTESDQIEELDSICAVSEWSDWTTCSVTCGRGVQTRLRNYKNSMGRKKCNLETRQTKSCVGVQEECEHNHIELDPECLLTPWSDWSPCSVTCGKGFRMRTRFFMSGDTVPRKCQTIQTNEKLECVGDSGMDCSITMADAKALCMLSADPGPCRAYKPSYSFNIEKGMCTRFVYGGCKGNRNRFMTEEECLSVCGFLANNNSPGVDDHLGSSSSSIDENVLIPQVGAGSSSSSHHHAAGGNEDGEDRGNSPSPEDQLVEEPEITPQKIDCLTSDWSPWSPCSVTCGQGTMVRTRTILAEPQNNGKKCPKKMKRRRNCHVPC